MHSLCLTDQLLSPQNPTRSMLLLSLFCGCYCSVTKSCLTVTPWTAACQASPSITSSWSLPKLMSIELVMPSNHLIPCHPLFLLPLIFPSIRVFSNELVLCKRWPKYWSFSFSMVMMWSPLYRGPRNVGGSLESPKIECSGPVRFSFL